MGIPKKAIRCEREKRKLMFQKLKAGKKEYKCQKEAKYKESLKKTQNFYKEILGRKDDVIQKLKHNVKMLKDFIEEDNHYKEKLLKKQAKLHAETERLSQYKRNLSEELKIVKTELNQKAELQKKHDDLHNKIQ